MSTEAQKKASKKYRKNNTVRVTLELNLKTDSDIINALNCQKSKMGYIKDLIKKDIYKEEKKGV